MSKLKYFCLALILVISAFTHFYRLDHTFIFNNDEARDVLIVKKMIDTKSPVLLGPQTSIGNMYLGPLYYYFMLPPLLISQMNPVGPAMMVALFGVFTSLLLFYLGTKKYGVLAGSIAGLFYSLSPVMLHYSRSSWNPNLVPFFATLLLFAWQAKSRWGWLLFGLVTGTIFQLHYVALVMCALVGFAMLKTKPPWSSIFLALLGFFVISAPFWLFEFRHDFVNSQAFLTFLREGSHNADLNSSYLSRLMSNALLVLRGIVGSSSLVLTPVSPLLLSFLGIMLFLVLPTLGSTFYLWYLMIGSIMIISILKEPLNVHYIAYLFPVIALAFGGIASQSHRLVKLTLIVALTLLLYHLLPTLIYNLGTIDSVATKKASLIADYINREADGQPYNIVSTSGTYATSIEYYLALSQNPPTTNYAKIVYDICDGRPCPESDATTVLFYGAGPAHPSIEQYLGHPTVNEFVYPRTIHKNELVEYNVWVATMTIDR